MTSADVARTGDEWWPVDRFGTGVRRTAGHGFQHEV